MIADFVHFVYDTVSICPTTQKTKLKIQWHYEMNEV